MPLSFTHILVILSGLMGVVGISTYIFHTIKGTTKPNRVTWLMWAIAPILGAIVAFYSHGDIWSLSRVFLAGFLPLLVFIASFVNPQSYWKLGTFDMLCGLFSIVALVLWLFTGSSDFAIILLVVADVFASLPTLQKAWKNPETETSVSYLFSAIGILIALPAIPSWTIANAAFQTYLVAINAILFVLVFRKRFKL